MISAYLAYEQLGLSMSQFKDATEDVSRFDGIERLAYKVWIEDGLPCVALKMNKLLDQEVVQLRIDIKELQAK